MRQRRGPPDGRNERGTFPPVTTSSPDSPGLVYLFTKKGNAIIGRPTRDGWETVSECSLGEGCVTSPAFQSGRMYIRGEKHLFCIADE